MGQQINAVSNNGFRNPIGTVSFGTFVPSVAFSLSGTNLTVTDNSTYDGDYAFKKVNISITDYNGNKVTKKFTVANDDVTADLSSLVANGGYNLTVTILCSGLSSTALQTGIGAECPAAANLLNWNTKKNTGVQPVSMS